jgi:hypothetical protein
VSIELLSFLPNPRLAVRDSAGFSGKSLISAFLLSEW